MHRHASIFRCSLLLFLLLQLGAAAENLKLIDGTTFRDVRILEVRPDALIVWHRDGVAMAEFEKLPKPTRARYGFDARKAAAFRKHDAATRRAVAEENRRLIAAYEKRKEEIIRSRIGAGDAQLSSFAGFRESELTYRPGAADRAYETAVAYLSEEIAQAEEARIAEARKPDTFWNAPFWRNPVVTFIGSLLGGGERGGGFNSEPRGWR